jgi:cytochrome c oxidase subunit 3
MLNSSAFKQLYFSKEVYFERYLRIDVAMNRNFGNIKPRHYANDVLFTRWPFYIALASFLILFYFVMALKQFSYAIPMAFTSLYLLIYYLECWFEDIMLESLIFGKYNRKVRGALAYGFMLFLVSETFIFGGFFWGYFDRLFDSSVLTGGTGLPYGVEPLFLSFKPIYATLLLVVSGYFANWGIYFIHLGRSDYAELYGCFSVIFGIAFLAIQVSEYSTLSFTIADSVYGSCFYFLTGFHGLHVSIGLLFLIMQVDRIGLRHFNKSRLQGYRLAVIYWHFVDYIWIFLFLSVYVFNWSYSYYYSWH